MASEKGFYHEDVPGKKLPYALSLSTTKLVCHCAQIFNAEGGQAAGKHMKGCSDEQTDGVSTTGLEKLKKDTIAKFHPRFCSSKGTLCIRMNHEDCRVVCICGEVCNYKAMFKDHLQKCEFYKIYTTKQQVPQESSKRKPMIIESSNYGEKGKREIPMIEHAFAFEEQAIKYFRDDTIGDDRVKFFFPDDISFGKKDIGKHVMELQVQLMSKWETVTKVAEQIQGKRYMISWDEETEIFEFCREFEFSKLQVHSIIEYARQFSSSVVGDGECGSWALILCDHISENQGFHLDISDPKVKQFGMVLSNGVSSTHTAKHTQTSCFEKRDDTRQLLDAFIACVTSGIETIQGGNWMEPSDALKKVISKLTKTSVFVRKLHEGYGPLFEINRLNHQVVTDESLQWKSTHVENCNAGTISCIDGGVIHAGAGSTSGMRALLFWTWKPKNTEEDDEEDYDHSTQQTKLKLMAYLARDCWEKLDRIEKKKMLGLIYYSYFMSEKSYRHFAPGTFEEKDFGRLKFFLEDLNKHSNHVQIEETVNEIDDIIEQYLDQEPLFPIERMKTETQDDQESLFPIERIKTEPQDDQEPFFPVEGIKTEPQDDQESLFPIERIKTETQDDQESLFPIERIKTETQDAAQEQQRSLLAVKQEKKPIFSSD